MYGHEYGTYCSFFIDLNTLPYFLCFIFALSWSYVGQLADHHSQAVGISAHSLSSADLTHITGIVFNVNDVAVMRSHININTRSCTVIQPNHPLTHTLTPVHMGTALFTLCMRTGKKHTNPQWTPTVIECDSLCILSIAPGSWQLIGIYSSLNHW